MFIAKQKPLGPCRDVDWAPAVHYGVALRTQHAAKTDFQVQMRAAILREAHYLQPVRSPDGSFVRLHASFEYLEQRGFSASVGSHQASSNARRECQVHVLKQ